MELFRAHAVTAITKTQDKPTSEKKKKKKDSAAGVTDGSAVVTALPFNNSSIPTNASFASLGVDEWLIRACKEMGINKPTEIQCRCIPQILAGRDVMGRAQTGSGKTATFALPILQKLSQDMFGIFALVLTPTRELAFQIADQFRALGASLNLRDTVVIGGQDMMTQALELAKSPHVVIGTPGRIADHIDSGTKLHFKHLQFLVLDEADRLFEPCFSANLSSIVEVLPPIEQRQTLLFSATITTELAQQCSLAMKEPCFFEVSSRDNAVVKELNQRYLFVPQNVKECYLAFLLKETPFQESSVIVFTSTCRGCQLIAALLEELEIDCVQLHSRNSQARRLAALGKFRSGQSKVLVATDVASRGLDIPTVKLVINYDVPRVPADYVHRVGTVFSSFLFFFPILSFPFSPSSGGCCLDFVVGVSSSFPHFAGWIVLPLCVRSFSLLSSSL